ncbi:14-3-3 domain-containing protein, partial [Mycena olivaceomarginata]
MERRLRLDQAILAFSCGRYRDTLEILRLVACSDQELTLDERTLFASACGNLVKRLRYSCKATTLVESHPELPGSETFTDTWPNFPSRVERRDYTEQAFESYMMASHLAANHPEMPPTHPTRLALAINFSVFYHDILQNHDAALEHSCQAFNDGVKHLDWLTEETCTESILLLQILKDNSTIWSLTKNV